MTHLNPRLATMSGIDPARVRLQVFLFSAPMSAAPAGSTRTSAPMSAPTCSKPIS